MLTKRILIVAIVASLAVCSASVAAQDGSPSVTLDAVDIDVDAGDTSTVSAEYQFTVGDAGSGDSALSAIDGTLWKIPERSVSDLAVSVNGEDVEPDVSDSPQHTDVSVPVEGVSSGDTVTVTVAYQVSGPSGELQVPVWVPEYSTSGPAGVATAAVTLPHGQAVQGDAFPAAESISGSAVEYSLLHTPGFIKVNYGEGALGGLTADQLYSALGVVLILGLVIGGLLLDRRTA
jgi:hypothetical protein